MENIRYFYIFTKSIQFDQQHLINESKDLYTQNETNHFTIFELVNANLFALIESIEEIHLACQLCPQSFLFAFFFSQEWKIQIGKFQ